MGFVRIYRPAMRTFFALGAVFAVVALAGDPPASKPGAKDEAQKVAERYLNALTGQGDEADRELLLGGATMNAQMFVLENWKISSREPVRHEEGDLASAKKHIAELDKAAREALTKVLTSSSDSDGLAMNELSQADAAKLMAPTREKAKKFQAAHPVVAFVARVGKEVYWHPKNAIRPVLEKAGASGTYTLDVHIFQIETKEGPRQERRLWPLRVLRFKSAKVDTGWKILPASDWNGE